MEGKCYLFVTKNGNEYISNTKPRRFCDSGKYTYYYDDKIKRFLEIGIKHYNVLDENTIVCLDDWRINDTCTKLPNGTIKKLTGEEITFLDNCIIIK